MIPSFYLNLPDLKSSLMPLNLQIIQRNLLIHSDHFITRSPIKKCFTPSLWLEEESGARFVHKRFSFAPHLTGHVLVRFIDLSNWFRFVSKSIKQYQFILDYVNYLRET